MEFYFLLIFVGIAYYLLEKRIRNLENKNLEESIAPYSIKYRFDLHRAVVFNPLVLKRANVKKEELDVNLDFWSKELQDKWYGFLEDENSNLKFEDTNFNLTYLAVDNMFIIETKHSSFVVPNRTPSNNTNLFGETLRYYTNKDKDLRNEDLRLEVLLRSVREKMETTCVISVGIREFENKTLNSTYNHLFDFPFSHPNSKNTVTDDEYKKYGFEIDQRTPWYDKDDFGEHVVHRWDTEKTYKHKETHAEITLVV